MEETVTISKKEYDELLDSQHLLNHLEAQGVDNWQGYSHPPKRGHKECSECMDEYPKAEMQKDKRGRWFCPECCDANKT